MLCLLWDGLGGGQEGKRKESVECEWVMASSVDGVGGEGERVSDELLVCLVDSSVVDVKGRGGMTRTRERE